jgi:signal peptidase
MTPAIRQGELAIVKPQASYAEGDIITFSHRNDPTQFTTHRIVQRSEDKDLNRVTFTTKGDANDSPDLTTTIKSQIVGKVLFSLPLIGYLVAFAKTQLGFVILVVIPATILIYEESKNLKKEISQAIKDKKESSTEDVKEEPVKPKKSKTKRKKKSVKK